MDLPQEQPVIQLLLEDIKFLSNRLLEKSGIILDRIEGAKLTGEGECNELVKNNSIISKLRDIKDNLVKTEKQTDDSISKL